MDNSHSDECSVSSAAPASQVSVEVATVYRCKATGRRYFSKYAAWKKAAWKLIEKKYPDVLDDPHEDAALALAGVAHRYARRFSKATRTSEESCDE